MLTGSAHTAVCVRDVDEAARWYAEVLGADDHVPELIEYPEVPRPEGGTTAPDIVHPGITHVGLVCDDIEGTRAGLEQKGVAFLTSGIADVAGLRTTWFKDPWGTVFILMEKRLLTAPTGASTGAEPPPTPRTGTAGPRAGG